MNSFLFLFFWLLFNYGFLTLCLLTSSFHLHLEHLLLEPDLIGLVLREKGLLCLFFLDGFAKRLGHPTSWKNRPLRWQTSLAGSDHGQPPEHALNVIHKVL